VVFYTIDRPNPARTVTFSRKVRANCGNFWIIVVWIYRLPRPSSPKRL
jgi:hypothetical protein